MASQPFSTPSFLVALLLNLLALTTHAYQPTPGESEAAANANPIEKLHRAVLAFLPPEANDNKTVHDMYQEKKYQKIKALLDTPEGIKLVNHKDHGGMTPFAWAVVGGHIPTVHLLIEKGADLHMKSNAGHTPLQQLSSHNDKVDMVKELIAKDVDVDVLDDDGDTALHHAVFFNAPDVVELLLNKGANVDIMNKKGQTPLAVARKRFSHAGKHFGEVLKHMEEHHKARGGEM